MTHRKDAIKLFLAKLSRGRTVPATHRLSVYDDGRVDMVWIDSGNSGRWWWIRGLSVPGDPPPLFTEEERARTCTGPKHT